ncbi:uncharacterized protein METZ01_LOCUS36030 [marine metagenome]|uniref:Uncharacterized protein n=1 Tax=marine metagenome TaxID=408172 RepID=A0A381QUT8_9ZZZZ
MIEEVSSFFFRELVLFLDLITDDS